MPLSKLVWCTVHRAISQIFRLRSTGRNDTSVVCVHSLGWVIIGVQQQLKCWQVPATLLTHYSLSRHKTTHLNSVCAIRLRTFRSFTSTIGLSSRADSVKPPDLRVVPVATYPGWDGNCTIQQKLECKLYQFKHMRSLFKTIWETSRSNATHRICAYSVKKILIQNDVEYLTNSLLPALILQPLLLRQDLPFAFCNGNKFLLMLTFNISKCNQLGCGQYTAANYRFATLLQPSNFRVLNQKMHLPGGPIL